MAQANKMMSWAALSFLPVEGSSLYNHRDSRYRDHASFRQPKDAMAIIKRVMQDVIPAYRIPLCSAVLDSVRQKIKPLPSFTRVMASSRFSKSEKGNAAETSVGR